MFFFFLPLYSMFFSSLKQSVSLWGAMMEGKWGIKIWEIMSSIVNKAPLYLLTRDEMWRIWRYKMKQWEKTFETHQQEQMFYENHEGPHYNLLPCVGWYRQQSMANNKIMPLSPQGEIRYWRSYDFCRIHTTWEINTKVSL